MKDGNVLIIFNIFIAIFITIIILVSTLFMAHVNNILYNVKLDMYSIAKSGIISVNKNRANIGDFQYDIKTFQKEFERLLKLNYELDDDFSNSEKLISKVVIKECKIYDKGNRDGYTKQRCDDRILHIVLDISIKPIVLRELLENIFVFQIHEDVNLNSVII